MSAPPDSPQRAARTEARESAVPTSERAASAGRLTSSASESAVQEMILPFSTENRSVMPPHGNLPESSSVKGGSAPYIQPGEAKNSALSA